MSTQMEKSLWAKQKQPIVQEFIDERKKLISAAAGKGFLLAPGLLYEYETGLEIDTKQKLSLLSRKILAEAVDRDIKQAGLDYNFAFKSALVTWELEKQTLLDDWDKELAGIKRGWSQQENDMDQLAIQVSLRGIILINTKTDIELQMEELRKQLVEIEDDTADYEYQFIQQKIITATRKLEVIPILQSILTVEQAILVREYAIVEKDKTLAAKESEKVGYLTTLVDAEVEIADKKRSDLLPVMQELIGVSRELTVAIREEIGFELSIMAQKVIDAGIMVEKAEMQVLIAESGIDTETARLALMDAKITLSNTQRQYELELIALSTANTTGVIEQEAVSHASIMTEEQTTQSNVVNLKVESVDEKLAQDVSSSDKLSTNSVSVATQVAGYHYDQTVRTATINATSKITAALTHLIG